jgi:hypothetical protein
MLERLTIKTDICIEPENEIVYHNPNDPEGMYNILDLAECLYSGGEAEAGILMEISRRLVAYEDTGLTPAQVEAMKMDMEQLRADNINAEMNLAHMTADKDEQAGRLMRYDTALKQAKEALQEAWGDDGSIAVGNRILETIKAIDALLGGKENGK